MAKAKGCTPAQLALAIDDGEVSGTRYPVPQMATLGI